MPPALQPVPVRIMAKLVTVLGAIAVGSSYFNTIKGVHIGKDPIEIPDVPAINIGDVGSCGVPETGEGRGKGTMWWQEYFWDLPLFVVADDDGDILNTQLRLAHDVHRALMANRQLDGEALDIIWGGWRHAVPPDEHDVRAWIECAIRVRFRHRAEDMTVNG